VREELINRIHAYNLGLGVNLAEKVQDLSADIPKDYRGVSFDTWLDIFLEYALCLARKGRASDSYKL